MRESLRGRLLLWHLVALATVVSLFSASVAFLVWRSRLAEIDEALVIEARLLAAAVSPAGGGTFDLVLGPTLRTRAPDAYYVIWSREGTLIDASQPSRVPASPPPAGHATRNGTRELVVDMPPGVLVLTGHDLSDLGRTTWSLTVTLLGVGAGILVLSVGSGWLLIGRALAPIDRINATARQMIDGDLAARIPVDQVHTELGQVGRALNDAFDGLRSSIARQRRFTADASHELRTPLATLSTEVQWALGRERSSDQYRESLEVCLRAAGRMQGIVERLLTRARADVTSAATPTSDVDLNSMIGQVLTDVKPLAETRHLSITYRGAPFHIRGRTDELRDAITNVVVNAIRYNIEGGRISLALEKQGDRVALTVADTGVGIRPEDLPFIFDPFFRADSSRSHDAGGAGLGLAVTRTVMERHGGSITCTSQLSVGTTMVMVWPAPPAA
jgi:two-component system, OmpR family, sensor kinase